MSNSRLHRVGFSFYAHISVSRIGTAGINQGCLTFVSIGSDRTGGANCCAATALNTDSIAYWLCATVRESILWHQ